MGISKATRRGGLPTGGPTSKNNVTVPGSQTRGVGDPLYGAGQQIMTGKTAPQKASRSTMVRGTPINVKAHVRKPAAPKSRPTSLYPGDR